MQRALCQESVERGLTREALWIGTPRRAHRLSEERSPFERPRGDGFRESSYWKSPALWLIEAKEAGYQTQGVEIFAPMTKYASERWGVPVTAASIERIELPSEEY